MTKKPCKHQWKALSSKCKQCGVCLEIRVSKLSKLQIYEDACEELSREFVGWYFDWETTDFWWVGDTTGEVLAVNDYFFNMDVIAQAMRLRPTGDQLFGWYEQDIEYTPKKSKKPNKPKYNLSTYMKLHP